MRAVPSGLGWLRNGLFFLCLALAATSLQAAPFQVLPTQAGDPPQWLSQHWDVLEDNHHAWDIDQVASPLFSGRFTPTSSSSTFGLTESAFWLRITLINAEPVETERLLEIPVPHLHQLDLYSPTENGFERRATGQSRPFAQRPLYHRDFVFPLQLPPRRNLAAMQPPAAFAWTRVTHSCRWWR
jgi:two-component system, sensor histidine kinase and response regulator